MDNTNVKANSRPLLIDGHLPASSKRCYHASKACAAQTLTTSFAATTTREKPWLANQVTIAWRSRLKDRAVPLTKLQSDVLRVIATGRAFRATSTFFRLGRPD
jgi:hypothetical protein